MLAAGDNLKQSVASLRAHKLRAALTMLGLTMGVATLIAVVTLVQGANVYVEEKIANLGTNVFRIARTPFAATDFNVIIKALKYKKIAITDAEEVARRCAQCQHVGATASSSVRVRFADQELTDISLIGQTASMADIDTRVVERGRYFTPTEDDRGAQVCLIGATLNEQFFSGVSTIGRIVRIGKEEFSVIGLYEKLGSVLGQDQDGFVVIPMRTYLRMYGARAAVTINVKAAGGEQVLQRSIDEARLVLRARRHLTGNKEDDFFVGTSDTFMQLWAQISGAFFAVFILVSSISAVVGGIVIMNVMLVSVTERTKEIGIRRAVGATQQDIRKQFLAESVLQCIVGGVFGILAGFLSAVALRQFTDFPAAVQTWVAILGVLLSSSIGLFFGIYPAVRASRLDPVVALRTE